MDMLFVSLVLLSFTSVSTAKAPYCLAGDTSCFPGPSELAAFNASVGGRLSAPPPYGNVCYDGTFDLAACQTLVNNKQKGEFRENITAAMMYVNNEFDWNGSGCPVPNMVPSSPLSGPCVLGALGTYFVNAQSAEDVSLAVKFAAKYNLRLRIKNVSAYLEKIGCACHKLSRDRLVMTTQVAALIRERSLYVRVGSNLWNSTQALFRMDVKTHAAALCQFWHWAPALSQKSFTLRQKSLALSPLGGLPLLSEWPVAFWWAAARWVPGSPSLAWALTVSATMTCTLK
jgi:hypothetical protein